MRKLPNLSGQVQFYLAFEHLGKSGKTSVELSSPHKKLGCREVSRRPASFPMRGKRQFFEVPSKIAGNFSLFLSLLALCMSTIVHPSAQARTLTGWKICNRSAASYVRVAIGYDKINAGWWSEGWWSINRNECKKVIGLPLARKYYYYYAKGYDSSGNHKWTWRGNTKFCIENSNFDMGENSACLNAQSADFRTVNVGQRTGYTTRLTSP